MSLVVVSRRITAEELGITKFTDLLGSNTSCFIKDGVGLIGWGEAQRLSASGKNRFEDLDNSWKEVVESAEISDQVNLEGSGLIAFGAMAFSANSQIDSCLVVPKLVIGSTNGEYFITTVNTDETQAKSLIQNLTETQKLSFVSGKISAEDFSKNVADAINLISSGLVSKIVLARDLVSEASNFNPNIGLRKLSEKFSSCYTYLVDGMFGTSPELLVQVTNREVSARVLAGTAGRGTDVEVDRAIGDALSHSHKNLAEHK
ncbi:MAG: chorismate-binding protein, partial [Acidobacteria bacterium]|nr:chorismate-binding protein [Acidobacteriota bacterium]